MEENETNNREGEGNEETSPKPDLSQAVGDSDVLGKLHKLELENHKMQTEFNMQRAKLKELFIQKEAEYAKCQAEKQSLTHELNELKSQFFVADLKMQEEISSLQQMVQDTIEESNVSKIELERVKEEFNRQLMENKELRDALQQHHHQESTSLGPQVLSQVKKTLARKLGGDSTSSTSNSVRQDSVDEITKKSGNKYAHEEAEVLRSIVIQLQEEMKALKEKLREADDKLQSNNDVNLAAGSTVVEQKSNNLNQINDSINKSTSMEPVDCLTCHSYETKVQSLLKKQTEDEEKIEELQKSLEEANEALSKEAALRTDLENQWQEKREAHKKEVQLLHEEVKRNENKLLEQQQQLLETKEEVFKQLQLLTEERERVNKHLETLQADNDYLSGQYLATAEEIQNQYINLPNKVEELQELMLRQQSELIQARLGSEFEKKKCVTYQDEVQILREQLNASNNEREMDKKKAQRHIKSLEDRLKEHLLTVKNYEQQQIALERKEAELRRQISDFHVQIIELTESNEKLTKNNAEYKAKIKNLQEDQATSELVQKDFVQLSQELQMTLEKLRIAEKEVRWRDDDDVDNCPSCRAQFTVTVRKIHCRHCGDIYCDKCLSHSVPSGPRNRLARVCNVCYTLLTPDTAPYFSHKSLQSS